MLVAVVVTSVAVVATDAGADASVAGTTRPGTAALAVVAADACINRLPAAEI